MFKTFYGCCVVMKGVKTTIIHSVLTILTNKCTFIPTQSSHTTVFFARFHSLKSQVKKLGQLLSGKYPCSWTGDWRCRITPFSKWKAPKSGTEPVCKSLGTALSSNSPAVQQRPLEGLRTPQSLTPAQELKHTHLWVNLRQIVTGLLNYCNDVTCTAFQ